MKTWFKDWLIFIILGIFFTGIAANRLTAQTYTVLTNFLGAANGAYPQGGLISSGNVLYGVTASGGPSANGLVFRINNNGTAFTNLHNFTPGTDGSVPYGPLVLAGNVLYGSASAGGTSGNGTVFRVNTDGTGFTNLHNFVFLDGVNPFGALTLVGDTLYGTAASGGSVSYGTVFAINTNGTGFTVIYNFGGGNDGAQPNAGLVASGNLLYGTTIGGGVNGYGVVFALSTNGAASGHLPPLHSFSYSEGVYVYSSLILSGNTLYGSTYQGGANGRGSLFSIQTNGSFQALYNFTALSDYPYTSSDGGSPRAPLILTGGTLYGVTTVGGSNSLGTLFAIKTNGTGFTNLRSFNVSDGAHPRAGLLAANNTLYGMGYDGGASYGTIFTFTLPPVPPPPLAIYPYEGGIIVMWSTNAAGFTLQYTTNLAPPIVWNASPASSIIDGQNAVIDSISSTASFYRLIK